MIRNLVAGVLCGGVVSALGLGVISQVTTGPQAGEQPVIADAGPAVAAPAALSPKTGEGAEGQVVDKGTPPEAPAPADGLQAKMTPAEEQPAPVPQPPVDQIPADQTAAAQPEVTLEDVPEVAAAPVAQAPATTPAPDDQAPDLAVPGGSAAPQGGDAAPAAVAQAPASQPDTAAPALSADPALPAAVPAPSAELPAPVPGQPTDPLLEPGAEAAPAVPPGQIVPMPQPEPTPEPDAAASASPQPATQPPVVLSPGSEAALPPVPGLPKGADGVTVGRLPTIGGDAKPAEAAADQTDTALPVPQDLPPLQRYAMKFENPSGKPLFALVLTDDGSPDLDRAKLAALPFPVTFAVDPMAANAAAAAATYRAGGKEVVMLASGLPAGATAADVEQSFQAMFAALPETVAVIDMASAGFQDDRALATQIVAILKSDGRGLITYDRGLNAADQVARREKVAAAIVFRDLDAQGEEVPMIRRYLDRAAFKAAQEGRVTVVGKARPETVAALMEWSIEGRASSVTLAPASAVMVAQ